MLVGGEASDGPDIEETLLQASEEGMLRGDLRVLAVLVTWFGVHSGRVDARKLSRLVAAQRPTRVRAFWSALARWQSSGRRLGRLAKAYLGPQIELLATGTEFQVARHGEDPRFLGSKLRVPANFLRDRPSDILTPAELARQLARRPTGATRKAKKRRVVGLLVRGRVYRVVLTPDRKVGGYTVQVPALPGCITEGDTLVESKRMAREAIALWLESEQRARGGRSAPRC
jgi:predicted RNase H-like HicB family nuclease